MREDRTNEALESISEAVAACYFLDAETYENVEGLLWEAFGIVESGTNEAVSEMRT